MQLFRRMNHLLIAVGLGVVLLYALNMAVPALVRGQSGAPATPSSRLPAKRFALVIGIADYEHWPALTGKDNDAREIAHALKLEGFTVDLLTNAGAQTLKTALQKMVDHVGISEDQSVLVYFAGHSKTETMADGTQADWLIAADCPRLIDDTNRFRAHAIRLQDVVKTLFNLPSRQILTLLDTVVSEDALNITTPRLNLLGTKYRLPVRQFIVSGRTDDQVKRRSTFKHYVLKGLRGGADTVRDGLITGSELAVYLQQEVARKTDGTQLPRYAAMGLPGQNEGDFTLGIFRYRTDIGWLTVKASPPTALVRVLNIKPKFEQGMALKSGKYLIEVTAEKHFRWRNWIAIDAGRQRSLEVALRKVKAKITNGLGMSLNLIRPDRFKMGSPKTELFRHADETRHEIELTEAFYIQTTEVTRQQFEQFVLSTGYKTAAGTSKACWFRNSMGNWEPSKTLDWQSGKAPKGVLKKNVAALPVACVSWEDAQAFVDWLSRKEKHTYRLPTEAQWEFACRAGSTKAFASGLCLSKAQANFSGTGGYETGCAAEENARSRGLLPVASLAPNAWGLFDMHGNVAEWCQDWYGAYPRNRVSNPAGPERGAEKIVRGGHMQSFMVDCRSASRLKLRPDFSSQAVGFRVVMIAEGNR